jgi:hypothetical protein
VNNPWTPAFATEILSPDRWQSVKLWIYGHTHFSNDFDKNGVRVVSNQRGYVLPGNIQPNKSGEKGEHMFDSSKTIDISLG